MLGATDADGGPGDDTFVGVGRAAGGDGADAMTDVGSGSGGEGDDRFTGTDLIGGDDRPNRVLGGPGNDRLIGGAGFDRFDAGAGDDRIDARYAREENYRPAPDESLDARPEPSPAGLATTGSWTSTTTSSRPTANASPTG